MLRLEEITVGARVIGLVPGREPVTIIATTWYGTEVLGVSYKDAAGCLNDVMLYRDSESALELQAKALPWSFDADGDTVKLVSEATRINLAHLFDPYLAVHTSSVEPLPHQISAVYEEMLTRLPLRFLLADDPGAGKTIMTGLFLKELIVRGDLKRCLIISPGSLSEQWQDELYHKFHLRFEILTNDRIESAVTGNVFQEMNFCIVRLDKLSRDEHLQEKLCVTDWDLIVVDEAHKMSATIWGNEPRYTKRFKLGRKLSAITRHLLLLTATPHNGKDADFQLFLSLLDSDRFEGASHTGNKAVDVSDIMRRLVKEELLKFDGTPLFPERCAYTVNYELSDLEALLYDEVSNYVREEFNRADKLDGERKTTVGFALTILQRRLASSPEAIYQSLTRRRKKLEQRLEEEKLGKRAEKIRGVIIPTADDAPDEDDYSDTEREELEDAVSTQASASATIGELTAEINTLKHLENLAAQVRSSGRDRKWEELSALIQDDGNMFGAEGQREKLIIFTEHRDTLNYLAEKLRSLLGKEEAVVTIRGGMVREERRRVEELFRQDKEVRILIATDAAGEGINLQRAHLMVNYDLPWNPNRLEQRFGRIHRIGQTEVCHLWNLVANQTREGDVFRRLFEKLEQERAALGGKVFDILGRITFENRPLRDLLIEAVRYGNDPKVRARLKEVVDHSLDKKRLEELLKDRALTEDAMDVSRVLRIRSDMELQEARKLQPHYIAAFFREAFTKLGGRMRPRDGGARLEITSVPLSVRNRETLSCAGEPVLNRYERVCFEREHIHLPGQPDAELLCPGHPLMEAVLDIVREKHSSALKQGTVLVDERDTGTEPRLLMYLENSIRDGRARPDGQRILVSRQLHFVELFADGSARHAGPAPYLDYRAATPQEQATALKYAAGQDWLMNGVEERATRYAATAIIPQHFSAVRRDRLARIEKVIAAVKERLTAEIQYWDFKAGELKTKEAAGKVNANLNSDNAARRAEDLAMRLNSRLAELEREKNLSPAPPNALGGALIIPAGLLRQLNEPNAPNPMPHCPDAEARKTVETAAMNAVMDYERSIGNTPHDVSADKCGYDVKSAVPDGTLRLIEVKGRARGADSVTLTRNEILTAINVPENYLLALVEVENGRAVSLTLLKNLSLSAPDFSTNAVVHDIADLKNAAEVILQQHYETIPS